EWCSCNTLGAYQGMLYFIANDGVSGVDLWRSDGTAEGTVKVKDWSYDLSSGAIREPVQMDGILYFIRLTALWRTDGTDAGTWMVKQLIGDSSSESNLLTVVGNRLFFRSFDYSYGSELWMSDGTPEGTARVKDILPGASGSKPSSLVGVNGRVYFAANDGASGTELWRSDGTPEGTVKVKELVPGVGGSAPTLLTRVGGMLYFAATDALGAPELWKSDGTEEGTVRVRGPVPGLLGTGDPVSLLALEPEGVLLFAAADAASGVEVWRTDGTEAGTVRITDIAPGPGSSRPRMLTRSGNRIFLSANDGWTGLEPWLIPWRVVTGPVPPAVTCPEDVTTEATGVAGADVSLPEARASDDTAPPRVTYSPESGSAFPLGDTQVSVTAQDEEGLTA
ncbi:MAG: HYR domain-containing protein, partial [Myxococcaceae bacterium]